MNDIYQKPSIRVINLTTEQPILAGTAAEVSIKEDEARALD